MSSHRDIADALAACDFDASPETIADVSAELRRQNLPAEVDRLLEDFGKIVEDAGDKIVAMWASARAIHVATGLERARIVAEHFEPFARLIVALEVSPRVATPVPAEVSARLRHLLPPGVRFPEVIPPPAIGPGETDFAAGVRLGISRARIFERKPVVGQLRRRTRK